MHVNRLWTPSTRFFPSNVWCTAREDTRPGRLSDICCPTREPVRGPVDSWLVHYQVELRIQWVFIYVCCTWKGKEPPCKEERDKILGFFPRPPPGMFVPQCREDGGYKASQCHGSTGFCWCVDEYGNELTDTRIRGPLNCSGKSYNNYLYIFTV